MNRTPRRTLAALGLTALAVAAAPAAAGAVPAERAAPTSFADVLAADGREFDDDASDFDVVDAAITAVLDAKPDSPLAVVADGSQPATAFLPSDSGMWSLVYDLTGEIIDGEDEEQRVFTRITELVDIDTIEQILLYHVVPGETLTFAQMSDLPFDPFGDGTPKTTAQGATLAIHGGAGMAQDPADDGMVAAIQDQVADGYGFDVIVGEEDINLGNPQIVQQINDVLEPFPLFDDGSAATSSR
ncbi:MAG: fasciclin domain-containing protein [Phycicoccus sp.]